MSHRLTVTKKTSLSNDKTVVNFIFTVIEISCYVKKQRKERFDMGLKTRLKKAKVKIVSESNLMLKCKDCGQVWSPNIQPGGKLPKRYWVCPNGCNDKK